MLKGSFNEPRAKSSNLQLAYFIVLANFMVHLLYTYCIEDVSLDVVE